MGIPPKKPQFTRIRIKGKSRETDLAKIGITGRVRVELHGDRGNRVLEITRLDDDANLTTETTQ